MGKTLQYKIIVLLLGLLSISNGYGQNLILCGSESFSNASNLIDGNPVTKTSRDASGLPASICVNAYHSNYIKSITVDIEEVNRAILLITVSDRKLYYDTYPDYYDIVYGHIYQYNGEIGEVTIDVNQFANYVQLWELSQGTLILNELSVEAEIRKVLYTYDAAGNRISRQYLVTANKSASDVESEDPQKFNLDKDSDILLYPNPTSGILNFEVTNQEMYKYAEVKVKIYSVNGSLIMEDEYKSTNFTVDISEQVNGTYLLDLEVNGKKQHFTIIKQ